MNVKSLDGCNRCPKCHMVPTVKFHTEFISQQQRVVIGCEKHGHEAMGDDVEMAVRNWNIYLELSAKLVA